MVAIDNKRLKEVKAEIRGVLIANKFPVTPEELCEQLKGNVYLKIFEF